MADTSHPPESLKKRLLPFVMLFGTVLLGMTIPVQTGLNKGLGDALGSAVPAVGISFSIGCMTTFVPVVFMCIKFGSFRLLKPKEPGRSRGIKPWEFCGGLIGSVALTTNVFVSPILGFTLYAVMMVSGQLTSSLVIDHVGFVGLPVRRASPVRIAFVVVTLCGCILTNASSLLDAAGSSSALVVGDGGGSGSSTANNGTSSDIGSSSSSSSGDTITASKVTPPLGLKVALALAGLCAGCILPMQAAINRRFSTHFLPQGRSMAVGVSFFSGCIFLLVVAATLYSLPNAGPVKPKKELAVAVVDLANSPWYNFLGGILGGIYVSGAVFISPILGVSTFFVSTIAGLLVSSMAIDASGAFGVIPAAITLPRALGVVTTLVGAAGVAEEARITGWFRKCRGGKVGGIGGDGGEGGVGVGSVGVGGGKSKGRKLAVAGAVRKSEADNVGFLSSAAMEDGGGSDDDDAEDDGSDNNNVRMVPVKRPDRVA